MISPQHKQTAQWAMQLALTSGCQAARVSVSAANNNSFEYRNTQLDHLQQSTENKFYIEFFVDGRYGSFSTNRIERKELELFIKQGISSTRYLAADTYRQLPSNDRYYQTINGIGDAGLDLYDQVFVTISTQQKLDLAQQAIEEIRGTDKRIVSISASYGDGIGGEYMLASNGFEAYTEETVFSLNVEVALKAEGDARPESYWYDSAIYWHDLQKQGIATKALQRAVGKLGQQKIQSGRYAMLLDNTTSSRLLSPLIGAMQGAALQQKQSFLLGKLGQQITSPLLTINDTPHLARAFGARYFDGEGVATSERTIIENGILNTYFIDTYNGLKMGLAPTIASPSIISTQLGNNDCEELMQTMQEGIWVTGFNGGNTNPTSGDFSFGVEGFLVQKGLPTIPISEMNITGNLLTLWQQLVAIGNDPRKGSSFRLPSLLFEGVNFSGL